MSRTPNCTLVRAPQARPVVAAAATGVSGAPYQALIPALLHESFTHTAPRVAPLRVHLIVSPDGVQIHQDATPYGSPADDARSRRWCHNRRPAPAMYANRSSVAAMIGYSARWARVLTRQLGFSPLEWRMREPRPLFEGHLLPPEATHERERKYGASGRTA